MAITKAEIEHIADLAYLYIDPEKFDKLASDMADVVGMVGRLKSLDLDDVDIKLSEASNRFREDVVGESLERERALKNAALSESGCFAVPKVVE